VLKYRVHGFQVINTHKGNTQVGAKLLQTVVIVSGGGEPRVPGVRSLTQASFDRIRTHTRRLTTAGTPRVPLHPPPTHTHTHPTTKQW